MPDPTRDASPYVSLYITRKQAETIAAVLAGMPRPKRDRAAVFLNVEKALGRGDAIQVGAGPLGDFGWFGPIIVGADPGENQS